MLQLLKRRVERHYETLLLFIKPLIFIVKKEQCGKKRNFTAIVEQGMYRLTCAQPVSTQKLLDINVKNI